MASSRAGARRARRLERQLAATAEGVAVETNGKLLPGTSSTATGRIKSDCQAASNSLNPTTATTAQTAVSIRKGTSANVEERMKATAKTKRPPRANIRRRASSGSSVAAGLISDSATSCTNGGNRGSLGLGVKSDDAKSSDSDRRGNNNAVAKWRPRRPTSGGKRQRRNPKHGRKMNNMEAKSGGRGAKLVAASLQAESDTDTPATKAAAIAAASAVSSAASTPGAVAAAPSSVEQPAATATSSVPAQAEMAQVATVAAEATDADAAGPAAVSALAPKLGGGRAEETATSMAADQVKWRGTQNTERRQRERASTHMVR